MEFFEGVVIKGKSRGKKLGFPTANVKLDKEITEGIYVANVSLDKKNYNALVFIGSPKTFEEIDFKAEVYIFNFNKEIYGQSLKVKILKKIRDNKKFSSPNELILQMKKDKKDAIKYFKNV